MDPILVNYFFEKVDNCDVRAGVNSVGEAMRPLDVFGSNQQPFVR